MALIHPSHTRTRHWNGALQARLIRAPLEQFLTTHRVKVEYGVARDSDNLARAAVFIIDSGLKVYFSGRVEGLADSQHSVIGRLACVVSRAVAAVIFQPDAWRIPALLSTARLLTPWIGLNAAARASASSTHVFTVGLTTSSALPRVDIEMAEYVSAAVKNGDPASITVLAQRIAARLLCEPARAGAAENFRVPRAIPAY